MMAVIDQSNALLLQQIWREACKHIEIGESTSLMAPILAERLPIKLLLVRRVDVQRSCIETVGVGHAGDVAEPEHTRHELRPAQLEGLLAWCRAHEVACGDLTSQLPPGVVPAELTGPVLIGPLSGSDGPAGVLLLVGAPGGRFEFPHEFLFKELLEPFSIALENDRRLREMNTLREAAEADKRSLLTRLGRDEIGDTIVGADAGLRHVMERVELVARSDVPVLILGETGSGKEVVARSIHARSRRHGGPFLRVNCGAIPSELIDSELFGHERGSFTGAISMRKGWFERADRGTLFLDEIGELPPAAQVRLLRILQDGAFERVGGQRQLNVDVRIVAATHRNLQEMVGDGRFREDLWYRIAVFPIDLPPLRDRPGDIPALAAHFALKACRRFGFPPLVPSAQEMNLLCGYNWPGNVRELGAVMDRAAILGDGKMLEVAKAIGPITPMTGIGLAVSEPSVLQPSADDEFPTLDLAMQRHIEAALRRCSGQIEGPSGAASLLDINPHTLRARMRKLGVNWRQFRG